MICWMFPGQPVAFSDMSAAEPEFREISALCQQLTGFNPLESGPSTSGLSESVRLQLFGTCTSLYYSRLLARQGGEPDLIAEHSMGVYPALAAAGSIDVATAIALTYRIGAAMAQLGRQNEYALGCIIGMASGPLKAIAANNGVHIANHNTTRHFLLAGERSRIETAAVEAAAGGAFSVRVFPCDASLHTPLIGAISAELQRVVADYSYREPRIPLMGHIDQTILNAAAIPGFLVDELCRPVYWEATYRELRSQGVTRFHEVGASSALSKFNRWIDSES